MVMNPLDVIVYAVVSILIVIGIIIIVWIATKIEEWIKMQKEPQFEIFRDEKQEIRFRLKAPNGEIICQSEGYTTKQACQDTMAVLAMYAAKAKIVDLTL